LRVIVDTNIVLDVLLEREPFVTAAVDIFALAEKSRIDAFLCTTTIYNDRLLSYPVPSGVHGAECSAVILIPNLSDSALLMEGRHVEKSFRMRFI